MISKIYSSADILHKAWSRKGKTREQIALKEEFMKDKKVKNKATIKKLLERRNLQTLIMILRKCLR